MPDDKLGFSYKLNFSKPFNTTSNFTTLLEAFPKAGASNGATNVAPNYVDGALLANDHEFFLYGGLTPQSIIFKPQDANEITGFGLTPYGCAGQVFNAGGYNADLTDGVTRYVTFGGAANAPSENKAWYFGGMRSASHGLMYASTINQTVMPTEVSNTLITLDLKSQGFETWSNNSKIPENVKARANPEVVWVPVGEQGILTVIGGVTFPGYANIFGNSSNPAQSVSTIVFRLPSMGLFHTNNDHSQLIVPTSCNQLTSTMLHRIRGISKPHLEIFPDLWHKVALS